MIIYKCAISLDELFSDIYKITETANGMMYEVEGKMITRSDVFDDALIGANASCEEGADPLDENSTSGIDIVLNHNLQETSFVKKDYITYMKGYMKAIKTHLMEHQPDRVERFMADAQPQLKSVLEGFKDFQFFTGQSMNTDGAVGLLNFREDGITPYMLFFKDGLLVEKC